MLFEPMRVVFGEVIIIEKKYGGSGGIAISPWMIWLNIMAFAVSTTFAERIPLETT